MSPGWAHLVVREAPEDALLRSARALRRMGARLTRFDVDDLALEARLTRWRLELVVGVRGVAAGDGTTQLSLECARSAPGFDFGLARLTIARVRGMLAAADDKLDIPGAPG